MPTVSQGVRSTQILGTETRAVRDVTKAMAHLERGETPVTTMLMKMRKRVAKRARFEWFEDEPLPRFDSLAASLTAAATTMTVTNFAYFRAGDLVKIANGEIVRVSTTPTTTAVTIARAYGETAAAAASTTDQLFIIGNSHEEGSAGRAILSTQKVPQHNFCGIIRDPWSYTTTNEGTEQYGGQDKDEEEANMLYEHKKNIELSLWFGERYEDTTGTHPKRSSRGIFRWITTNSKNVATLTEAEFEDWLRVVFRYGAREKLCFLSPKVITVINGFARSKLQTATMGQKYGVTITQYQNSGRFVGLVEHPLFTNDSLGDLTGIAGYGACIDMADLELRYMPGFFTALRRDIQDPDVLAKEHEYVSEVGLELHHERKHGELSGVLD